MDKSTALYISKLLYSKELQIISAPPIGYSLQGVNSRAKLLLLVSLMAPNEPLRNVFIRPLVYTNRDQRVKTSFGTLLAPEMQEVYLSLSVLLHP